jgi:hypothetical protein
MSIIRLGSVLAATVVLLAQTPSFAGQIFFSNLVQPGNQFGPDPLGIGHTPSFTPGDTGQVLGATGFTPAAAFRLTSFDIALVYAAGFTPNGPNQADVSLTNDAGGLPGSTIESWHLTNIPSACGLCPLTTVASVSNPTLLAGDQYWIVASGGLQTFDLWTFTLSGSSFSPLAIRTVFNGVDSGWQLNSSGGGRQGALVVSGDAVPEPASLWLTILALPLFFWMRSRAGTR